MAQNKKLRFKIVDNTEFWQIVDPHFNDIFSNRIESSIMTFYSDQNKLKLRLLKENLKSNYSMFILIYQDTNLVGWHFGNQINEDTYYMKNSAILEEYQGNSYYTQLLKFLITKLTEKGFQLITSAHHSNNAAILIPKLRQGFLITSTELNDQFGFLVHLKYFINPARKKAFGERIGLRL